MALNFPSSPIDGQIYFDATSGNRYVYNTTNGVWKYAANNSLTGSSNGQVIFNNDGSFAGSNGLYINVTSNTVYTNTINVTGYLYGNGAFLTGVSPPVDLTAANNWANTKLSNTSGVVFEGNLNIKTDLWIGNNITNVKSLIFNTSTNRNPDVPGELTWSQDDLTLHFEMDNNVVSHIGQDAFYLVKNQTGSTINKGTVVRFAGTVGASGRLLIAPAIANNSYPSKYVIGVTAETIIDGDDGFVISQGKIRSIDTSMFSEGDILYLSSSTPGAFSNTMPTAPNNKITVAAVVKKDASLGTIEVRPTLGSKLNEDELVELNSLANGHVITYVSANARFENSGVLVSAYDTTNSAFGSANTAGSLANQAGVIANSAFGSANTAGASANTAGTNANTAGTRANTAGTVANGAFAAANQAGVIANSAFGSANTAGTNANGAGTIANAAFGAANAAGTVANNANTYAGSTYVKKAGDTISGDLVVTGNLTISGNTTYANTQTLLIGDAIITLNNDLPAAVAPSENAGVEVKRGSSANVSVIWNETSDKWTFTNDGTNFRLIASNTDVESANNYAGTMANAAGTIANAAFGSANTAGTNANTAGSNANQAGVIANAAFGSANTRLANTSGIYFNGDLYFPSGNVTIGGTTTNYKLQVYGSFAANTKSFVIDHPTKEGMKLRHGSLEGPENGVYVRGICDSFSIELPDYWVGLVHEDSITVSLTPIGYYQNLYVEHISNNVVYVSTDNNTPPYCHYHIFAERKDVEKLVVEF